MPQPKERYQASSKLDEVWDFILQSGGVTADEIMESFHVAERTAYRYLDALKKRDKICDAAIDGRKVWKASPLLQDHLLRINITQMIALYLGKTFFSYLEGTGIKEQLDKTFCQLNAVLRKHSSHSSDSLDKKVFAIIPGRRYLAKRKDDVNAIITALLDEKQLQVRHASVDGAKLPFVIDPYTLVTYKNGLYIAAYSHFHKKIRTFSFDGFESIERMPHGFTYPDDYHPAQLYEGAFGMIKGDRAVVEIFFTKKVRRFVTRNNCHPRQKNERTEDGLITTMEVDGTVELESHVLSFGKEAVFLRPKWLWKKIYEEAKAMVSHYEEKGKALGYLPADA